MASSKGQLACTASRGVGGEVSANTVDDGIGCAAIASKHFSQSKCVRGEVGDLAQIKQTAG